MRGLGWAGKHLINRDYLSKGSLKKLKCPTSLRSSICLKIDKPNAALKWKKTWRNVCKHSVCSGQTVVNYNYRLHYKPTLNSILMFRLLIRCSLFISKHCWHYCKGKGRAAFVNVEVFSNYFSPKRSMLRRRRLSRRYRAAFTIFV